MTMSKKKKIYIYIYKEIEN